MTKYEFTDETADGLRRIRALRDIPHHGVSAGDLGGFIRSERNLSHFGDAWVGDNARVSGDATVCGSARVFDDAWAFDNTMVYGDARVYGRALLFDSARVSGNARVSSPEHVFTAGPISTQGDPGTLCRTNTGHQIVIGCWTGTADELRVLARSDEWPSKSPVDLIDRYRPRLFAFADFCEVQMSLWN